MYLLLQLAFFALAYLSIFLLIFCLCSSIIQSILILTNILSNAPVASSQSQGRASVCAPLLQSDFVFAAKLFSWRSTSTRSSFLGSLTFESCCPRQLTWDIVDLQVCWQEVGYWSWAIPHISFMCSFSFVMKQMKIQVQISWVGQLTRFWLTL